MKQFFKWIGKHIAGALVFSLFSILFIAGIVYALTYPSAPPAGEVAGGKFMQYFNNMRQICPVGQIMNGLKVDNSPNCIDQGLGIGQTWQDMSASRIPTRTTGGGVVISTGSTYINTTTKPIVVAVIAGNTTGHTSVLITVDNRLIAVVRDTSTISQTSASAIIPPGSNYSVNIGGSGVLQSWLELRSIQF